MTSPHPSVRPAQAQTSPVGKVLTQLKRFVEHVQPSFQVSLVGLSLVDWTVVLSLPLVLGHGGVVRQGGPVQDQQSRSQRNRNSGLESSLAMSGWMALGRHCHIHSLDTSFGEMSAPPARAMVPALTM